MMRIVIISGRSLENKIDEKDEEPFHFDLLVDLVFLFALTGAHLEHGLQNQPLEK